MSTTQTICRYFAATGNCFYGDHCNFAHVRSEQTGVPPISTTPTPTATPSPAPESKSKGQVQCRNIALYGFCKYQGKGCEYYHGESGPPLVSTVPKKEIEQVPQQSPAILKRPTSDLVIPFQNMNMNSGTNLRPKPEQIEHEVVHHNGVLQGVPNMYPMYGTPSIPQNEMGIQMGSPYSRFEPQHAPVVPIMHPMQQVIQQGIPQPSVGPQRYPTPSVQQQQTIVPPPQPAHVKGGTTYFYGAQVEHQPPPPPIQLQYNPMASSLPHTSKPGRRALASFFMPEDIRQDMLRKSMLSCAILPEDPRAKDIPKSVQRYHSLYPLDSPSRPPNTNIFGYATSVYKSISSTDGLPYTIRKIEGFRLSNEQALRMGERWKQIQHPNIVGLSEVFISKDFGEVNSLFFAYHFHPGSETLEERFLNQVSDFIPEQVLWSYIIQLANAIRFIHSNGLACRGIIHPAKVILTSKNRIRLNCVGINDVVNFDGGKNLQHFQQDDLLCLGKLILVLACKSMNAVQNLVKSVDFASSHYSADIKNLLVYLLSKPTTLNQPTIEEVMSMISGRMVNELENLYNYADLLEADLYRELENGRLFRLLTKLGFINERPEHDMDPSWSETGDRYLLKLFRDYVFHQTYEDNTPVIDFAHVIECLNKLDAGVPEKIVLMSRDEQSLLTVSYRDLKRCIEVAYNELYSRTGHTREYM